MARAVGPERRLLAVYTGGTIGMRSERGVLVPGTGLAATPRTLPMFHDEEHARALGLPEDTLVLPPASPNQRILYTVLECQPLFDSSDMTIAEWVLVAQTIQRHYEQYHGFVVIHGTDTMAFAASVLSFTLENLQKTVVVTGAQVPIHALWSDGRENLLGALPMAGQYVIPEVASSSRISCFGATGRPRWTLGGSRPSAPGTCRLWPPRVLMSQSTGSWCGGSAGRPSWWCMAAWSRTWDCSPLPRDPRCSGSGVPAASHEGRGHGDLRLREWTQQARPAAGAEGGDQARPGHCQLYPLPPGRCDHGLCSGHGLGGSWRRLRLRHDVRGCPGQAVVCAGPAWAEPG
ncbi:60 kDa lysophospholipase [Plecturocebus cupreus]